MLELMLDRSSANLDAPSDPWKRRAMSFEECWILPPAVAPFSDEEWHQRVRALLPQEVEITVSGDLEDRSIRVELPLALVEAVASTLATREGQLQWDWRAELDPPRGDRDRYTLSIDLVTDERPILRIYSNDGDNRAAWPIVFSIASSLAEEVGGIPEEDFPAPSDRIPMFVEPTKASDPH